MQWPFFLSPEFNELRKTSSFEATSALLFQKGLPFAVAFFIEAAEDKTWIKAGGGKLLGLLFAEFTRRRGELTREQIRAIAKAVQRHHVEWKDDLTYDLTIALERETIPVASLLFYASSDYFRDLIDKAEGKKIETKKIDLSLFHLLSEFIYTGKVEDLWKKHPNEILQIIRQSVGLGLKELSDYASSVIKRYLNLQNISKILTIAQRELLHELELACCAFLNESHLGFRVEYEENSGLAVTLDRISPESEEILEKLWKQIVYFLIGDEAGKDPSLIPLMAKISSLIGLDLHKTTALSHELILALPSVKRLNLSRCPWLTDDLFLLLIEKSPGLVTLEMEGAEHLSYRSYGGFSHLPNLTKLNLNDCRQMSPDDFDLIASGIRRIVELRMDHTGISDGALRSMAKQCTALGALSIRNCDRITGDGLIQFAEVAKELTSLDLRGNRSLTEEKITLLREMLPQLTRFEIADCAVSDSYLRQHEKRYRS